MNFNFQKNKKTTAAFNTCTAVVVVNERPTRICYFQVVTSGGVYTTPTALKNRQIFVRHLISYFIHCNACVAHTNLHGPYDYEYIINDFNEIERFDCDNVTRTNETE